MAWRQPDPQHLIKNTKVHEQVADGMGELAPVLRASVGGVDESPCSCGHSPQFHHVAQALQQARRAKVVSSDEHGQHELQGKVEARVDIGLQLDLVNVFVKFKG
eukprot:scaffold781_cov123-Isochrysis_galbana.AAC.11